MPRPSAPGPHAKDALPLPCIDPEHVLHYDCPVVVKRARDEAFAKHEHGMEYDHPVMRMVGLVNDVAGRRLRYMCMECSVIVDVAFPPAPDAKDAIPPQPTEESPILAFQAWAERRTSIRRPLTQDEYFLAQEAFFAAHPGKGPTSSTMGDALPPAPDAAVHSGRAIRQMERMLSPALREPVDEPDPRGRLIATIVYDMDAGTERIERAAPDASPAKEER
jgi:hypothetical protein